MIVGLITSIINPEFNTSQVAIEFLILKGRVIG